MFWSYFPFSLSFQIYPPYILSFFFFNPLSTICAAHILLDVWLSLKGSQPTSSCQLPITPYLGLELMPISHFHGGFCLSWACTDLVHVILSAVNYYVQLSHCIHKSFLVVTHCWWLWQSLTPFPIWSLILGMRMYDSDVLFTAEHSSLFFSASWPIAGLYENCHLLQKKKKLIWWGLTDNRNLWI